MGIPGSANLLMLGGGAQAYEIDNSLRFRASAPARLTYDNTSGANNSSSAWTLSFWMKRGSDISSSPYGNDLHLMMWTPSGTCANTEYFLIADPNHGNTAIQNGISFNGGGYSGNAANKLRDPSAWYHVVWRGNTGSSSNIIYINGVAVSAYNQGPSSQSPALVNGATRWSIGNSYTGCSSNPWDGYLAEVHFIDGSALAPTDFGEFNADGVWVPKKVTGVTYGANGYFLDFSDPNNIGADRSGNGNNWTPSGFELANTSSTDYDWMAGSPTNNHAVRNSIYRPYGPSQNILSSFSNANLSAANGTASPHYHPQTVAIPPGTGPVYMEGYVRVISGGGGSLAAGATLWRDQTTTQNYTGVCSWTLFSGNFDWGGGTGTASGGGQQGSGMTIGVYVDRTNNEVRFYKNGTLYGTGYPIAAAADSDWYVGINSTTGSNVRCDWDANFGQRPFVTSSMDGKGMCTALLPDVPIKNPSEHFNTVLYTGNGASTRSITGLDFQPDLVWIKDRSASTDHLFFDAVRGANKILKSVGSGPEETDNNALTSFNSNGFTLGTSTNGNPTNTNGRTYVAWCWKAGGTGSSNTAGSITSTVSANPTAGFSIVTWTGNGTAGATIGHGLGVKPSFFVVKCRNLTGCNWDVYHSAYGATKHTILNGTNAVNTYSGFFNNTEPTSTLITLGSDREVNQSSATYVAYCFSEVEGYSKFGNYAGNSSTDGVFVYTGFRPAFVMCKNTQGGSWFLHDTTRMPYNPAPNELLANSSLAEGSSYPLDILSNGFKWRSASGEVNTGPFYIYMAFAEHPFGGANVSPSPAR